jgi:hypothetical protein
MADRQGERAEGARKVLLRMMRDIRDNDVPSETTWAAACAIVGWPVPKPIAEVAGKRVSMLDAVTAPRAFNPDGEEA